MKKEHHKKGIALITVLIVATIMMLLLGSFVRINQQNFGLIKNDFHHAAASEAARSAQDYCLFRLEQDRFWGRKPFEGGSDSRVSSIFKDFKEVAGESRVIGTVKNNGADFEIKIINNIDGHETDRGVSKGHCRLTISAKRGTAQIQRQAVLTTAPLFDAGVIASRDIKIDADQFTISSLDPLRNRMRALSGITVPDHEHFRFNPAAKASEKGVLWAGSDIALGNDRLENAQDVAEASRKTGGRFLPNAKTYYDIYDLQLNEVRSSKNSVSVDSGILVFGTRNFAYVGDQGVETAAHVPIVERRDWAVDSEGRVTHGDVREVWFMSSALPADRSSWQLGLYGDLPEEGLHEVQANNFSLDDGVHVHFNALDPAQAALGSKVPPQIVINSDVNLEVQGDFGIASFDGRYRPSLVFRDPGTGSTTTDEKGEKVSGSITCNATGDGKPGSIYIEGFVEGNGKLLAQGDVTIRNTYANVESDKESDLSIYAGGEVRIRPQQAKFWDSKTKVGKAAEGTTAFRGLVYAKGDILFEADKANSNSRDERFMDKGDLHIEGAIVSKEGSVMVKHARNVNFVYNPEYLDTILDPRKESRVRLERVVWKEM